MGSPITIGALSANAPPSETRSARARSASDDHAVDVAGESSTRRAGTAQQAPIPGADPEASRTEGTGTGTTGSAEGAASSRVAGAQAAAQAPNDDGSSDTAGGSGSSLPLTGASVMLLLTLATAMVAAGLVAGWSSRVRVGHQS